jgi:hypothetical protein
MRDLVEDTIDIAIGPLFEQQIKTEESVADGQIQQRSFNIVIEAKRHGKLRFNQLAGHISAFEETTDNNLLMVITKEGVSSSNIKSYKKEFKNRLGFEVPFCSVTYESLIEKLNKVVMEHEIKLQDILDDYEEMCQEEDVISSEKYTMLVVSAGDSIGENKKYGIYYDPVDRTHKKAFKYLGLYDYKSIRAVGEVQHIVGCELRNGDLIPTKNKVGFDRLTQEDKKSIKGIIGEVDRAEIGKGHKFFLVDQFNEMDFKKSESGGVVRRTRYMRLKDFQGFKEGMSSQELAALLDGREWS